MKIDCSQIAKWHFCPKAWQERYLNNLELSGPDDDGKSFGSRFHQLLEEHHARMLGKPLPDYEAWPNESIESEALATFAAYIGHYPAEDFEVVDVEKQFEFPLWHKHEEAVAWSMALSGKHVPSRHQLIGKIDCVVRMRDTGRLRVLETKTEKRGGQYNDAESWAARPQVSLYAWAASQLYGEEVEGSLLNVISRRSPKGQEPPIFQPRQHLLRTKSQTAAALETAVWTADQIEASVASEAFPGYWERCKEGWNRCEFYSLHVVGRDENTLSKYREAKAYLDVPVEALK